MASGGRSLHKTSDERFDFICTPCEKKGKRVEAVKYCVECCGYCCQSCTDVHTMFPALENHNLMEVNQASGQSSSLPEFPTERCYKHKGKVLDMYCEGHNTVGCSTCFVKDHKSCPDGHIHSIPDMIDTIFKLSDSKQTQKLLKDMVVSMETVSTSKDAQLETLNKAKNEALVNVTTFQKALEAIVKKAADASRHQVETAYKDMENDLLGGKQSAENISEELQTIDEKLNQSEGNRAQHFVCTKVAEEMLKEADLEMMKQKKYQITDVQISFIPDHSLMEYLQALHNIGQVEKQEHQTSLHNIGQVDNREHQTSLHDIGQVDNQEHQTSLHDIGQVDNQEHQTSLHDIGQVENQEYQTPLHDIGQVEKQEHQTSLHNIGQVEKQAHQTSLHDIGQVEKQAHQTSLHDISQVEKQAHQTSLHDIGQVEKQEHQTCLHDINQVEKHEHQTSLHDIGQVEKQEHQTSLHDIGQVQKHGHQTSLHDIGQVEKQEHQTSLQGIGHRDLYKIKASRDINIKVSGDSDSIPSSSQGCCVTQDNQLLVTDWNNDKLKRFDIQNMSVVDYCKLDSRPNGVCCISKHEVAVACTIGNKILFVYIQSKMSPTRQIKMSHPCYGIAFNDGKLYVTDECESLYVYDMTGTRLMTITLDNAGNKLFTESRHITFNESGNRMYVGDWKNGVVCFDGKGNYLSTITDSDLSNVDGVCVDGRGNVFVVGWVSHNVVQYSETGEKVGVVVKQGEGIWCPLSVCFHQGLNRMFVTMWNSNVVKMYELE